MSTPREESAATLGVDQAPVPPPCQTVAPGDLSREGTDVGTLNFPAPADPPPNGQTIAHESAAPATNNQTLAHDSLTPADSKSATVRKGEACEEAGGIKLSLASKAGEFVAPGEIEPLQAPKEQVPGYELLGELGRGAMGVVYKARQIGLKRTVALKMILSGGHASRSEIIRFRTEAEAVARLQHPYIVQVFEIGEHRGLPFFSLEFVEGGCLADQIMDNPLPLRQSAELVRKLAEGMACAHENGIIHRDLKPANVLMTKDGDPKITDFGLAKKLEDDSGATRVGAIMGTPSYMAPEQAEGRNDLIGPHSDIYALGAILYDLITGRPPFRGATLLETLTQVKMSDPVPPARLHPKMPSDLETITLKCLLKEPKKRYHTARELAEDLRRFLAGEPIRARPTSAPERLWKWCKRRPTAAALIVVSVLSLLTLGLGGFAFALSQQEKARKEETLRKQAELNFRAARQAVEKMLTEVGQVSIAYEPRMENVRRSLLEEASKLYEGFLDQASDDNPGLQHDVAIASRQLGDARRYLGKLKEAEAAYRRSLELLNGLVTEYPAEPKFRQDLAGVCNNLANQLRESRRLDEAVEFNEKAIDLFQKLSDELPAELEWKRELAKAQYNRALIENEMGRPAEAAIRLFSARKLQQQLVADPSTGALYVAELVRTYVALGNMKAATKPAEAEQFYREARSLYSTLLKNSANDASARTGLMETNSKLGDLLKDSRPTEAGVFLRAAVAEGEQLVRDYPNAPEFKQALARARNYYGIWELAGGARRATARNSFEQSLAMLRQLAQNFPDRPDFKRELGQAEVNVALQLATAGLAAEAALGYRRAAESLRQLVKNHPGTPADERALALALVGLASVEPLAADTALEEALAIQDKLLKSDKESGEYASERAATVAALGAILLSRGQVPEAEKRLTRAASELRDLIRRFPQEPENRYQLASVRINQSDMARMAGRLDVSVETLGEARSLLAALTKEFPKQTRYSRELGKALTNLGRVLVEKRDYLNAEQTFREAIAIREELAQLFKHEPGFRFELAQSWGARALVMAFTNDRKRAEDYFKKAIDQLRKLVEEQPSEVAYIRELTIQHQNFARWLFGIGEDARAIQEWESAIRDVQPLAKQSPAEVGDLRRQLTEVLAEAGRWDEARSSFDLTVRDYREALRLAPDNQRIAIALAETVMNFAGRCWKRKDHAGTMSAATAIPDAFAFDAAKTLAGCGTHMQGDMAIEEMKRKEIAKAYFDGAVGLLRRAFAAGFRDVEGLGKAKEFEAMRDRDDYKKLIAETAKK